ncbi:MAG: YicC/YloC family endoribonuclease [Pseudomonadota bacterium]
MQSMTGFASLSAVHEGLAWAWDMRAVNGRGFDLRLRLAEGCEGLEAPVREAIGKAVKRGNVTVNLKTTQQSASDPIPLDGSALDALFARIAGLEARARAQNMEVGPTSIGSLLSIRGLLDQSQSGLAPEALEQMAHNIPDLVEMFVTARAKEGSAIARILEGQLAKMTELCAAARQTAEIRDARTGELLAQRVKAVLGEASQIEPDRLAQELALLAVKADVSEELDRLEAHIAAARSLVRASGPSGRKLDFLTQEFNREANTLCSKSGSNELTTIGLDMKVTIDQMREQAANVE